VDAPLSLQTTVIVTSQQVSCPLGDESAILNMKNSVYYGVNPVGATVWNLLKEAKTVAQIRDAILDEYEVDEVRCEKDLLALLEEMRSEGLIEVRGDMSDVTVK
jgi:Coenzyme PQQ synthesis protein D (PqqD)